MDDAAQQSSTEEVETCFFELALAIYSQRAEELQIESDPFEHYKNRVQQRICHKMHDWKGRFIKGYRVIRDEVESDY